MKLQLILSKYFTMLTKCNLECTFKHNLYTLDFRGQGHIMQCKTVHKHALCKHRFQLNMITSGVLYGFLCHLTTCSRHCICSYWSCVISLTYQPMTATPCSASSSLYTRLLAVNDASSDMTVPCIFYRTMQKAVSFHLSRTSFSESVAAECLSNVTVIENCCFSLKDDCSVKLPEWPFLTVLLPTSVQHCTFIIMF